MLKRMTFRNFVNFKNTHTLEFGKRGNGGVFTFVGTNGSGKSTVFEAIRRCSEIGLNKSISSRKQDDCESVVACLFEREEQQENMEVTKTLTSFYMVWKDAKDQLPSTYIAIKALLLDTSYQKEPLVAWSKWGNDEVIISDWRLLEGQILTEDEIKNLSQYAELNKVGSKYYSEEDKYLDLVAGVLKNAHSRAKSVETTLFDDTFRSFARTECLFAHRGISPIQSSDQIDGNQEDRYQKASEAAYVIKTFLNTCANGEPEATYDMKVEQKIFQTITSRTRKDYEFVIDEKGKVIARNHKEAPLLKVSEGIVGAKNISILLSKIGTKTLLLEEPGRGMHKNYIDMLVNMVFSDTQLIQKKTVILSTHNRDFLTPTTISNTFFFTTNKDGESKVHILKDLARKTCQFVTSDAISDLFFSERLIAVEGKADHMFVTLMKELLLQEHSEGSLVEQICNKDEVKEVQFRKFLATMPVIQMNGARNAEKIDEVCKQLEKQTTRLYLLDFDQKLNVKKIFKMKEDFTDAEMLEKFEQDGYFLWNYTSHETKPITDTADAQQTPYEPSTNPDSTPELSKAKKAKTSHTNSKQTSHAKKNETNSEPKPILDASQNPKDNATNLDSTQELPNVETPNTNATQTAHAKKTETKKGTLEDVMFQLEIDHDEEFHNSSSSADECTVKGCNGLNQLTCYTQFGGKCLGKHKFFMHPDLTYEDIKSDVKMILYVSVIYKKGQIWRFLEFLRDRSLAIST